MKKYFVTLFLLLTMVLLMSQGTKETPSSDASVPLPIPPLLEGDNKLLTIQKGELTLPFGTSDTLGYNGNYLGPTIRINRGEIFKAEVKNTLDEKTTLHWHGMLVPPEFDGGPHQIINERSHWYPEFPIIQSAATLWYHPHLMGKTGEQVYRGLAGLFIIEDEYSRSLDIPKDYGINDIPLILQEREVDKNGSITYRPSMPDIMHGYLGNVMLMNGAFEPILELKQGTYRFRVLNGSNSSLLQIKFESEREFTVIASDGGFLPESVKINSLILSPGERYEILVDFKKEEHDKLRSGVYGGNLYEVLSLQIGETEGSFYAHPANFNGEGQVPTQVASVKESRYFRMETGGMGRFTINGKTMDMKRTDFTVTKDQTENWTIENVPMGMMAVPHSFHVHDVQFKVLSVNGAPPPPLYAGPKDTVLLMAGDIIKIQLEFVEYEGLYMYHCHFLEHEDAGMMGQFQVD